MKIKTLVAAAASSFLAMSLVYAAPAAEAMYADDMSTDSSASPSDNSMGNLGADQPAQSGSGMDSNQTPSDNNANTSNSNDDSSADTATGDDDY